MTARTGLVVLSLLLSVAVGLTLSRRGGEATAGRAKPLIGLSLDTLKEERWQADRDLFVARAGELGADVLVQAANSDDARQIQDVEALISRKVDVLVIVPHNGAAMAKAVGLAHDAGIPVIAYDRMIPDANVDLYLSVDPYKVGRLQAQYLIDVFKGKGVRKLVRINGAKTDPNAHLVKKGQDDALAAAPSLKIVHDDWAEDWKPENAKKITQAALTRAGSFDAVLAANDGTAGGAIQALSEEGLAGKVVVTGQDAELAACQRVVAGEQAMTIYKPVKKLAALAAETSVNLARRRPVVAKDEVEDLKGAVPAIMLTPVIATRENMLATVVKDGFHSREDVFRKP